MKKTLDLLKKLKESPNNIYKFLPDEAKISLKKYFKINEK